MLILQIQAANPVATVQALMMKTKIKFNNLIYLKRHSTMLSFKVPFYHIMTKTYSKEK